MRGRPSIIPQAGAFHRGALEKIWKQKCPDIANLAAPAAGALDCTLPSEGWWRINSVSFRYLSNNGLIAQRWCILRSRKDDPQEERVLGISQQLNEQFDGTINFTPVGATQPVPGIAEAVYFQVVAVSEALIEYGTTLTLEPMGAQAGDQIMQFRWEFERVY
jgi:hypothetical protein